VPISIKSWFKGMSTTKLFRRWAVGDTEHPPRVAQAAINIVIPGLWLWLYAPLFNYLSIIFTREDFRTNQLILIGVIALIVLRMRTGAIRLRPDPAPHIYWPAMGMAVGGSLLYLGVERFLDINTVAASLFVLSTYGLAGLWLSPGRWRQGLPVALLLTGTLPFGDHLQTFVGYPMRIFTARMVGEGLAVAGISSIGVDTILVFENGVSQVDLPCSGVKSLWTGMLFLLAATWLEQRRLRWRWLAVAVVFAGVLFVTNLARVALLIMVGEVAGLYLLAEMLHVPLGVLGFVAACASAVLLLRLWVPLLPSANGEESSSSLRRPVWLSPLLVVGIASMALLYTPRPINSISQTTAAWDFTEELTITSLPLTESELDWFTRDGAESVARYRFEWQGVTGSMILITSRTWRAHHRPERCFEVYGLSLEESRPHLVSHDFPLRLVSLGNGQAQQLFLASYWFQSATQTTDDYATRIWADLSPRRQQWVLVSILFDSAQEPTQPEIEALYGVLHRTVARNLSGG
jgi:exosortase O